MSASAARSPAQDTAPLALRPAAEVMRACRAGASWTGPLSHSRAFVDKLARERWQVERLRIDLDAEGRGEVVYRLFRGDRSFHFMAVCSHYGANDKIDRSYGVNWDICAAFCGGDWSDTREAHLRREIPKQRLGRFDNDTLGYTRGNRSDRLFDDLVTDLAAGRQPDPQRLAAVGYIFRTTGFTANGLLGMRAFHGLADTGLAAAPYYAQMATAYLLRECVFDMADHMARLRNPAAATLHADYKRYLGIGNSAGLGLIPFIHNHPRLMHQWILARETAYAMVLARPAPPQAPEVARFAALLDKAAKYLVEDGRDGNGIFADWRMLSGEVADIARTVRDYAATGRFEGTAVPTLWPALLTAADAARHIETAELLRVLLLEIYPDIVAQCRPDQPVDDTLTLDPAMTLDVLRSILARDWGWLAELEGADDHSHFWYYADEAPYEPRRGLRGRLPDHEHETGMDTPFLVARLLTVLEVQSADVLVADLVAAYPDLRATVARVQSLADSPYGILRENTLRQGYAPFVAERLVLSCFGMEKLDPREPRSVKGAIMQGAPIAEDLARGRPGEWPCALLPKVDGSRAGTALPPLRLLEKLDKPAKELRRVMALVDDPEIHGAAFWRTSPIELRKYALRVLQTLRVPFGAGTDAARLVEFAEARCGIGLSMLAALAERGGVGSALLAAPAALDQAMAHGRAELHGDDFPLLDLLPVLAARKGLVGVLTWGDRLVVSLPTADGPTFHAGSNPDPAKPGTAELLCLREATPALRAVAAEGWSAAALRDFHQSQERDGIRVRRVEFLRIQALAAPSWLPIGLEPQIIPA